MSKQADDTALSKATEQLVETLPAKDEATQPIVESIDDREAREALEALKAEQEPPKQEEPAKEVPVEPVKEPEPPKAVELKKGKEKQPMIPKARLDEVLRERDELKHTATYLKGIVDANKELRVKAPEKPAEAVQTIEELLNEIDTQQLDLAKQYDNGQITMSEYKAKELQLNRQANTIRTETSRIDLDRIRREATAEARKEAMALSLEDHAARMDDLHPGVSLMPEDPNHPMWALLQEKATQSLSAEGVKLVQGDARSTMIFRQRMAELADKWAPMWTEKSLPGKTVETPPAQITPPSVTKPSMADQRLKKMELAHQQPPDTAKLGSSGTKPEITDAQVSAMSDDELAALPASMRARIKGGSNP